MVATIYKPNLENVRANLASTPGFGTNAEVGGFDMGIFLHWIVSKKKGVDFGIRPKSRRWRQMGSPVLKIPFIDCCYHCDYTSSTSELAFAKTVTRTLNTHVQKCAVLGTSDADVLSSLVCARFRH